METRHLVLAGRLAAVLGVLAMRGRARAIAWGMHDFLWLYPTLRRNCPWNGEVLTRFDTLERAVWLTIDDGPDAEGTPRILDLLAKHDAKAAFFVIGRKAEQDSALCRRIVSEGHAVENHTYSHPAGLWWAMPRPFVRREIERGSHAILSATGQAPRFFRSPVGMNNSSIHPVAAELGLRVTRIMRALRPGAITLLHEGGVSRHRLLTLSRLLDKLGETGYRCILPPEHVLR